MPTTRKRRPREPEIVLDAATRVHLELGDCLLAGRGNGCGCGLRDYNGHERTDVIALLRQRLEAGQNDPDGLH